MEHPVRKQPYRLSRESRRRLGAAVALVVGIGISGFGIWPHSHIFAIMSVLISFSAFLFAELSYAKWAWGTLIAACLALSAILLSPPILRDETEGHGWLEPGSGGKPYGGCSFRFVPAAALLFLAGPETVWTDTDEKSTVLSVEGALLLQVERDHDKLAFDADIYDQKSALVARIRRNEFHLISGKYSYRERSEDRSKLAVYDEYGNEMLYIDYINRGVVRIRGVFNSPSGVRLSISDDQFLFTDRALQFYLQSGCQGGSRGTAAGLHFHKGSIDFELR